MRNNAFKINNVTVNIEGGFIPSGKEYVLLKELINTQAASSGSFKMQFRNGCYQTSILLKVNYKKATA